MNNPDVGRILRLQVILLMAAVALGALFTGARLNVAVSTLLGGASALLPAWVYCRIAYARRHVPPAVLMRAHFRGEAVKFILTIVLFSAVLLNYKNLSVAGLFGGYLAVVSGYWFGLLIK